MARKSIWEWHRDSSSERSREQMRRVMEANANPGRTMGQMIGTMANAALTKGVSLAYDLTPPDAPPPSMFDEGMMLVAGMNAGGARPGPFKVPLSRARLPGAGGKLPPRGKMPRVISDETLAADRVKLLADSRAKVMDGVRRESAKLQRGPAPATVRRKSVPVDPEGVTKPSRFDSELKPFVDAQKVVPPEAASAEPGWFRKAAGWVGRKAVAPFDLRPSQWKAHPVKTTMKALADVGAGYVGWGIVQNKKANKAALEYQARQDAQVGQDAVNRNAAFFSLIDPKEVARSAKSNDFKPFDDARLVIGAAVRDATNPDLWAASNKVSYASAEAMARAMPKGAWYKYVSDKFPDQRGRFVRTEDDKVLDMSREDDVAEYGVQDFLERSRYRKEDAR